MVALDESAAERCAALGRVYVATPVLTEERLLEALRHVIQLGRPLRLTGFHCREEDAPVILRRLHQRGWVWNQRVTKSGRAAAAAGASPWA